MTNEEKIKFERMETSVDHIQRDVAVIKAALLGNELLGDKGLVGQIASLKTQQEILEKKVETLSEEKVKNSVYVQIIAWLGAGVGIAIISLLFSFFKK